MPSRQPLPHPRARHCLVMLACLLLALCSACTRNQLHANIESNTSPLNPAELLQTQSDRFATLAMRNNLNSLYRLMDKLYLRNPREWQKTGLPDRNAVERSVQQAIENNTPPPSLSGRKDIAALSHSLSDEFRGDRVGAFIYALGSMIITAHGGHTKFYITDRLDARFIHNAARNVEKAAWMLSNRKDIDGTPWLLSNEMTENSRNLSFAVEFAKIIARLDLLTDVLDERYRRIGVNYAHGLLFLNFLPVQ